MERMERDFMGIWIPREIWLSEELSLMEKVLFVEIHSLDNEQGLFCVEPILRGLFRNERASDFHPYRVTQRKRLHPNHHCESIRTHHPFVRQILALKPTAHAAIQKADRRVDGGTEQPVACG